MSPLTTTNGAPPSSGNARTMPPSVSSASSARSLRANRRATRRSARPSPEDCLELIRQVRNIDDDVADAGTRKPLESAIRSGDVLRPSATAWARRPSAAASALRVLQPVSVRARHPPQSCGRLQRSSACICRRVGRRPLRSRDAHDLSRPYVHVHRAAMRTHGPPKTYTPPSSPRLPDRRAIAPAARVRRNGA